MATQNKFTVNLEFTNMFSSTFVKTYNNTAIKVPNTSHLKNNLQYSCIHVSQDCLFNMSVISFSMQQTPHHSWYCKFLLNIAINHIFHRYFLKILMILSSPPFYSTQIKPPKVGDPVPNYILNDSKFSPFFEDALGAISMSMPLLKIKMPCVITVVLPPPTLLLYAISICDFSTSNVAGKGLWPMLWCSMIHILLVSLYPMGNIFLQMPCSLIALPCSISWPKISSCWVGLCTATVHITIILFSIIFH